MFDTSKLDLQKLGLEAACKMAYEQGVRDGSPAAFRCGMCAGGHSVMEMFRGASTVTAVYRNKGNTVLQFADGSKSKVGYNPAYGYGYDYEKAIMAAMLKNLVGNDYIKVLKQFVPENAIQLAANNDGREMVQKETGALPAPEPVQTWDVLGTPDGDQIRVAPEPPQDAAATAFPESPDDSFLRGLAEEPDLNDESLFQN